MKNTANIVTAVRLVVSPLILCVKPLSAAFFALYLLCGLSDIADGIIARKTKSESRLGAMLDSIADLVLVSVCLIKLLPVSELKPWLWCLIVIIAVIKLINYSRCRHIDATLLHTRANKLTGILLFFLPLTWELLDVNLSAIPVCAAALFAAVQEAYIIKTKS